jgi:uncharacterized protein YbjT (DUF2867 family)
MNTQPTILVLGATGKVGAEAARILSASEDVRVISGVRSPERATHLEDSGINDTAI